MEVKQKKIIEQNKCGLSIDNMSIERMSYEIFLFSKKSKKTLNNMSRRGYKFYKKNFEINSSKNKFCRILNNEKI